MTVSLSVKSVPEHVAERLRRRAARNHRSLQGELHEIVERAAEHAPPAAEEPRFEIITVDTGGTSSWSREDLYGDNGR